MTEPEKQMGSTNDRFGPKRPLSKSMESCPGGYWAGRDYGPGNRSSFGTTTVEALIARGVIEYTDWREGRNGKFPVAAVLVERDLCEDHHAD